MGSKSDIEWTDASWTPIRGRNLKTGKIGWHCEHATTGCEFCYAETLNKRLGTGMPFKPGHRSDIEIFLDEKMLLAPLKWKKPRMIFVCSMTDLFADFVPDEWIDQVFAVMALCSQHTFQVLTKRAERMRDYLTARNGMGNAPICKAINDIPWQLGNRRGALEMPLPNVWLGVSTERQKEADERIPLLLQTPAAVRFISAEPLLGHIALHALNLGTARPSDALRGVQCEPDDGPDGYRNVPMNKLDWVIVGGESGPGARPMHPLWVSDIRDWCAATGVPFFFKQWGAFSPYMTGPGERVDVPDIDPLQTYRMTRVGKAKAGRHIDGITHDAMPSPPDHIIKPPARRAGVDQR